MQIEIPVTFSSEYQEKFFYSTKRNICWQSGWGAGKTWEGCRKAVILASKFPRYRVHICRQRATDLRKTTMKTFYEVCPPKLYDESIGGKRADSMFHCRFYNGSEIEFLHLDEHSIQSLRSLETNFALIDQAEEVTEEMYLSLDARVGRWEGAIVPKELLASRSDWPRNPFTGKPLVPSYMCILVNPPDEGEFHYSYRRFNPQSPEHNAVQEYPEELQRIYGIKNYRFSDTHEYIESPSYANKALNKETLATMMTRDEEWVERFVHGRNIKGQGAVHFIHPQSLIYDPPQSFIDKILKKGKLSRSLDHGSSSPTCCTWQSCFEDYFIFYKEYYMADKVISYHRKEISALSEGEIYSRNIADPSIHHITQEKYGNFWTVAKEYSDELLADDGTLVPAIFWAPGDNNELATRNRINECLQLSSNIKHPITGESPAPKTYFIMKTASYPNGCYHTVRQIKSQKKMILDTINGKPIYCDERDKNIEDHAYDTVRYFHADHLRPFQEQPRPASPRSFLAIRNTIKALKRGGYYDRYGIPAAL